MQNLSFTIDKIKYEIGYFKAREGIVKYAEFLAYVGDGFGEILSMSEYSSLDSKVDVSKLGSALNLIVKNIYNKGDADRLVIDLLSTTKVNGILVTNDNFDELFSGKTFELMEILKKSIEVNFKGFFQSHVSGLNQKITAEA